VSTGCSYVLSDESAQIHLYFTTFDLFEPYILSQVNVVDYTSLCPDSKLTLNQRGNMTSKQR